MKKIKFSSKLVPLILSGEKISTRRLFDDKDLQIGDELAFINSEDGKGFAQAVIEGITKKKLGKLQNTDFDSHEKYKNENEVLEHYRGLYGNKVSLDTEVKIIKFRLK